MAIKRKSNQYIGLHLIDVFIEDTDPNSQYFRVSGIPEVFPGGKTAFRIDGSDLLKLNSEVKVEVLNAEGNVIYSEYPDYIEGSSRVVSIYVYSDELYGAATLTIAGEAKNVPPEWENHLNVRWQKTITVDPALRNVSPIKFYKPPIISAQELYTPYLVRSYTTSSSPESVDYTSGSVAGQMVGSDYMLSISGGAFIRQMEGGTLTVPTPYVIAGDNDEYQTTIKEVVNVNSAIAGEPYSPPDTQRSYLPESFIDRTLAIGTKGNTKDFINSPYSLRYEIEPTYSATENYKSFAKVNIADMETFSGDVYALKLFMKSAGSDRDFDLMGDVVLESPDLMIDENTVNYDIHYGLIYNETIIDSFWTSSRFSSNDAFPSLSRDSSKIRDAIYISGSQTGRPKDFFYTVFPVQDINFNEGSEYTFTARLVGVRKPKIVEMVGETITGSEGEFQIYMSGSAFNDSETDLVGGLGKLVGKVDLQNISGDEKNFGEVEASFIADNTGTGHIRFVIPSGDWYISQMSIKPSQETGFSPDNAILTIPILDWQRDDKLEFKAEFYDFEGKRADTFATSSEFSFRGSNIYIEGTDNVLTGSVYIGNAIGEGIEMAGVRSAYLRNVGYRGWSHAIDGTGPSGFMLWSGSVLTVDNPGGYDGVGLEIHGGQKIPSGSDRPHAIRFRTDTGRLEVTGSIYATDGFFSGSIEANQIKVPLGGISPDPHAYYDPDTGNYYRAAITQVGYAHFMSGSIGGWQIQPEGKLMAPNQTFMLSGSGIISSSNFYVNEAGALTASNATIYGTLVAGTGSIGGWKIGHYFLSASNIIIDSNGTLQTADYVSGERGWRITSAFNGYGEFENVRIRGTLRTTVFEKETVNAVGGQLWVANSTTISGSVTMSANPADQTYNEWPVENASGWTNGEVAKVKKVTDTGFTTEYVLVTSSSRLDPASSTDFRGYIYVTRSWQSDEPWNFGQLADPSGDSIIGDSGSGAFSYEPGQVVVSTGISQSGYIRLNANPRDPYTPYIDIVERTGSGVYDLDLKVRLGDLSGLSPGLLYGDTQPGFGLFTENVYLTGKITATTGSFTGKVHAGNLLIGSNVSSSNHGIFINNNNYWYDNGDFKVGNSTNNMEWDSTTLKITGSVDATYGKIGGFNLSPDALYSGDDQCCPNFFISGAAVTGGTLKETLFISSSEFQVGANGVISASAGRIAGFTIDEDALIGSYTSPGGRNTAIRFDPDEASIVFVSRSADLVSDFEILRISASTAAVTVDADAETTEIIGHTVVTGDRMKLDEVQFHVEQRESPVGRWTAYNYYKENNTGNISGMEPDQHSYTLYAQNDNLSGEIWPVTTQSAAGWGDYTGSNVNAAIKGYQGRGGGDSIKSGIWGSCNDHYFSCGILADGVVKDISGGAGNPGSSAWAFVTRFRPSVFGNPWTGSLNDLWTSPGSNFHAVTTIEDKHCGLIIYPPEFSAYKKGAGAAPAGYKNVANDDIAGRVGLGVWVPQTKLDVRGVISSSMVNTIQLGVTSSANFAGTSTFENVATFEAEPLVQFNVATTDGTDGTYQRLNNTNTSTNVQSGFIFQNGTTANTYKGAILFQDIDSWGRGRLHFALNSSGSAGEVTRADSRLNIHHGGDVGIGVLANTGWTGTFKLYVGGNIGASGNITALTTSDINLKKNISQLLNPLQKVIQLRGVEFDWDKKDSGIPHEDGKHDVGLIAQDVEKVIPEAVVKMGDGYKGIHYEKLVPLLVEAIKEQNEKISDLEKRIKDLEDGDRS